MTYLTAPSLAFTHISEILKFQFLFCDEVSIQSPESRVQSPESRVQSPESRVQSPESRVQSPESRVQSPVLPLDYALEKLVDGENVFVIQPTGSGKSLIFQSAPMVFDSVSFGVSAFLKFIFINVIFLGTIWRTP